MRTAIPRPVVTNGQLLNAIVLLVGVLLIAYGFFHPSAISFYAGLFVILSGVLYGVIGIVGNALGRDDS